MDRANSSASIQSGKTSAVLTEKCCVWAKQALTENGWQEDVRVGIDELGRISSVTAGATGHSEIDDNTKTAYVSLLVPAVANLHSHAFQRAMAGMTETRGPDPADSFWTWRKLMYRFLDELTPDMAQAIAAYGQMEMLESGYASVGEFHYLHHQANGLRYTNIAEMSERMVAAACETGIGLTLLPVLYQHGGCDRRALSDGQKRFGNSIAEFSVLLAGAREIANRNLPDSVVGVAPHSLRAVGPDGLREGLELADGKPFHIHIAEQDAEVEEIQSAWGARPVEWLLGECDVNEQWCLIHATQMLEDETIRLADTKAVAGLCPITESNLGDGIFDGVRYKAHHGRWGLGTDSNVRISLSEELRTLEYSQRLRDKRRSLYAEPARSTGRVLLDTALQGGAQALQRNSGVIKPGVLADMLALDAEHANMIGVSADQSLDAWIFAGDDSLVRDVWSAGRHMVKEGMHINRDRIESRYKNVLSTLTSTL